MREAAKWGRTWVGIVCRESAPVLLDGLVGRRCLLLCRRHSAADLIAYPKNGQSQEQQGTDRYQCHRWSVDKTGFDPTQVASAPAPDKRADYIRAQAACLEGRGYSVK